MDSINEKELSKIIEEIKSKEVADVAFSELLSRYMPLIQKRVLTYCGSFSNKSEAMQEASIALHSAAMTYDSDKCGGVTFGLYAGVCISNRLKSLIRKEIKESGKTEQYAEVEKIPSGIDLESNLAARDLCERVMRVAKSVLSGFEFDVFCMSFERYSTKDIAEALSKTPKSVDNAKFRISKRLRDNKEICAILSDI